MTKIQPPGVHLRFGELGAALEYAACTAALPWLIFSAPKAKGEPVLVLPGFLADDSSTFLLRSFLSAIGYNVHGWELGRSVGSMTNFLDPLTKRVTELSYEVDAPIRLLGWSRGGILAREVARDQPQLIDRVITLGSPVTGGVTATSISELAQRHIGVNAEAMAQIMRERNSRPIRVPITAIYSKRDGVVAWQACIDDTNPDVVHLQVQATHTGLGGNAEVFRLLGKALI
ncbi:MAG: esterase/lipase family protein [Pseudomonadales bacterium]